MAVVSRCDTFSSISSSRARSRARANSELRTPDISLRAPMRGGVNSRPKLNSWKSPSVSPSQAVEPSSREIQAISGSRDQVVAHAQPAITPHQIQLGQQLIAGQNQFRLPLLDLPPLPPQFRTANERFRMHGLPIVLHVGQRRTIDRTQQFAVGGRNAHQPPQAVFRHEQVPQGRLHLRTEEEILLARLGLFLRRSRTTLRQLILLSPGDQRTVAADLGRLQEPIGELQIPIGVLEIQQHVADGGFEFRHRDIRADPGQDQGQPD